MEATHGAAMFDAYDRIKQAASQESERPQAIRKASESCRSGCTVSVVGVCGGFMDKLPTGSWMNRSVTLRTGQCHVHRYMKPLLERIEKREIDPTRVITRELSLEEAPKGYEMLKNKTDDCEKVVLSPNWRLVQGGSRCSPP